MTENIIDNLYNLIKKLEKRVRKLEEKESLHEEAVAPAGSATLAQSIFKNKQCLICADNSHTIEECIISTNNVCFNCNKKGHLHKACHLHKVCHLQKRKSI